MTIKEILERLRGLERYCYRVCNDGGNHIDAWADSDFDGDLVMWSDIDTLIKDIGKENND